MTTNKTDRRQFLWNSASLASLAAGAAAVRSVGAQTLDSEQGQTLDTPAAQAAALEGTPGISEGQHFDAIYGVRSRFETAGRIGGIGAYSTGPDGKVVRPYIGGLTPVQNLIGIITPSALHYHNTHGYPHSFPRMQREWLHYPLPDRAGSDSPDHARAHGLQHMDRSAGIPHPRN